MECFGIPPHAWSVENFKKVCDQRGSFVRLDNATEDCENFCSAKILMETCCFQFIQGNFIMLVNGSTYDIFVKDVEIGESVCKHNPGYNENEVLKSCEENTTLAAIEGDVIKVPVMGENVNSHDMGTINSINDINSHYQLVANNGSKEFVLEPRRGPLIKRVYVRRNDQGQREMGQGAHDVNTTEDVNVTVIGTDIGT